MNPCIVCNQVSETGCDKDLDALCLPLIESDNKLLNLRTRLQQVLGEPVSGRGCMCESCQADLAQIESYHTLLSVFRNKYWETAKYRKVSSDCEQSVTPLRSNLLLQSDPCSSELFLNLGKYDQVATCESDLTLGSVNDQIRTKYIKEYWSNISELPNQGKGLTTECDNVVKSELQSDNGEIYDDSHVGDVRLTEDSGDSDLDYAPPGDVELTECLKNTDKKPYRRTHSSASRGDLTCELEIQDIDSDSSEVTKASCAQKKKGRKTSNRKPQNEEGYPNLNSELEIPEIESDSSELAKASSTQKKKGKKPKKTEDVDYEPTGIGGDTELTSSEEEEIKPLKKAGKQKKKERTSFTKAKGYSTIQCEFCGESFGKAHQLNHHMKKKHQDDNGCYPCSTCGKAFKARSQLKDHVRIHTGEKPFVCETCGKGFTMQRHLTVHRYTHSGERPYICTVCNKGFTQSGALRLHMGSHTGEKPYKCTICNRGFTRSSDCKTHMMIHTDERPFMCTTCGKTFKRSDNLRMHMKIHSGEKPFSCKECGKDFSSTTAVKVHMLTHTGEKPYTCATCGKSFRQNASLTSHMRKHTGEKLPKKCVCWTCGKAFTGNNHLKYHMMTHTGERAHKCTICSKAFTMSTILKKHMMTHTGEKPYVCSVCGKAFARTPSLQAHMRTHTGERPYPCPDCGKSFRELGALRRHSRTHTGARPYICPKCGDTFTQSHHMKDHMRSHDDDPTVFKPPSTLSALHAGDDSEVLSAPITETSIWRPSKYGQVYM